MRDISPEARQFVEENAPDFVLAVQHAKEVADQKQKPAKLTVALESFEDDPFLLYACLWYGTMAGVTCVFSPEIHRSESGNMRT